MFSAISITGTAAAAVIEHVTIRGEEAPQVPVFGVNLLNAIDAQKFLGADPLPLSLLLTVRDSTFEHLGSGVPVANLRFADVSIVGNRFDGTLLASEIIDLAQSRYRFVDNEARTVWAAIDQYDGCLGPSALCGIERSSLLIAGNRISEGPVYLEGTFKEDVRCRVVGNTFGEMPGLDVYLGEGTHDCLVTGASIVEDHGTNNHVRP